MQGMFSVVQSAAQYTALCKLPFGTKAKALDAHDLVPNAHELAQAQSLIFAVVQQLYKKLRHSKWGLLAVASTNLLDLSKSKKAQTAAACWCLDVLNEDFEFLRSCLQHSPWTTLRYPLSCSTQQTQLAQTYEESQDACIVVCVACKCSRCIHENGHVCKDLQACFCTTFLQVLSRSPKRC